MTGIVKLARPSVSFEQIPRALIQHAKLSQDAKWIPIWLAAKPPTWEIRSAALMRELGWSKERYYRAVKLLAAEGYWSHHKFQTRSGTFCHHYKVRLEPLQPGAGNPASGDPESGSPESGKPDSDKPACLVNTREKNTINSNNVATPVAKQTEVVVVSDFFLESNLLEPREVAELKSVSGCLANENPQRLIDEICGQIRKKGRTGDLGIKHPIRLLKKIATSKTFDFAEDERERREAKLHPHAIATYSPAPERQGTQPPARFTELLTEMKRKQYGK